LVLPDNASHKSSGVFLTEAYQLLEDNNYKPGKEVSKDIFYHPNLYFPTIEFQEGVFFLSGYESANNVNNVKRFQTKEIVEFHSLLNTSQVSPKEGWKEDVMFYAPYNAGGILEYRKTIGGQFSEEKSMELIVKNSPNYTRQILDYTYWEKYNKNVQKSARDLELYELWYEIRRTQDNEMDTLMQLYSRSKISKQEFAEQQLILNSSRLFLLLENDFNLTISFCNFLKKEKGHIDDFKALFEEASYRVDKNQLIAFLEGIDQ
jgi:hypothetical protein